MAGLFLSNQSITTSLVSEKCFVMHPFSGHTSYLGANVTAFGAQLIDLRLGDVSSLLSLVQLVLQFAELSQMSVGLLLLQDPMNRSNIKIFFIDTSHDLELL